MEALQTPIIGESAEARALEAVRLATLAERTRLENLQQSLDVRARRLVPLSSRPVDWLCRHVFREREL